MTNPNEPPKIHYWSPDRALPISQWAAKVIKCFEPGLEPKERDRRKLMAAYITSVVENYKS